MKNLHELAEDYEDSSNKEVSVEIYIRRNHGEWEEPLIEVEE